MAQGHTNKGSVYGCHELEVYPDDRLTCGSGQAMIVLDMKGAFDDRGTPNDFSDDKPRGTRAAVHACATRAPRRRQFKTGAKVTDCVDGQGAGTDDLTVAKWLTAGAPSLEGVRTSAPRSTRAATPPSSRPTPSFDSREDIDFDHEAELTTSRRFVLATDERGGGVTPPGATCPTSPADNPIGNGGIHAYRTDRLKATDAGDAPTRRSTPTPATPRAARRSTARPIRTQPQGSLCTAHVFQQIPGQNRIFMGWYSQGTQVVDFTENPDGTIDFKEAGYFIPANANTWVVGDLQGPAQRRRHVHLLGRDRRLQHRRRRPQRDRRLQGHAAGAARPAGRHGHGGRAGARGLRPPAGERCATVAGFRRVGAKRAKRGGLRLNFTRQSARSVRVDVFRQAKGRSITKLKRVKAFRSRKRSFTWKARGVRNGHYVVRFRTQLADGSADLRRIAVQRKRGRFTVRPAFQRANSCTNLVGAFRLNRPVFGGKQKRALFASFRLNQAADVKVTVTRNGKVVRTTQRRSYAAGKGRTIRVTPKGRARGDYVVTISAERQGRTATAALTSRRL